MKETSELLEGSTLRRILLPGAVAVSYVHPYIQGWLLPISKEYFGLEVGIILAGEALFFGLLISSAMLPIFYVYEGFKLAWLTKPAGALIQWNKKRLRAKLKTLYGSRKYADFTEREKNLASKLYAKLADFPIEHRGGRVEFVVDRPTRLGNIIASYESYPRTRYGIDGLTFWSHLLVLAPEAARKGYEESVTFGESMVLTSASGALVAFTAFCALCGRGLGALGGSALQLIHVRTSASVDWLGLVGGLMVWFVFYRLSLPAHREVRSAFQALTDLTISAFIDWVKSAKVPVPPDVAAKSEELSAYLRFLKNPSRSQQPSGPAPMAQSAEVGRSSGSS